MKQCYKRSGPGSLGRVVMEHFVTVSPVFDNDALGISASQTGQFKF